MVEETLDQTMKGDSALKIGSKDGAVSSSSRKVGRLIAETAVVLMNSTVVALEV